MAARSPSPLGTYALHKLFDEGELALIHVALYALKHKTGVTSPKLDELLRMFAPYPQGVSQTEHTDRAPRFTREE